MIQLKRYLFFSLLSILLVNCKAYQKDTQIGDKIYEQFSKEQKTWASPEGDIAYMDKGSGIPLLLLHGVPTSGWLYRKMIDSLAHKGYRVIVPDMLGFGNSAHPRGYDIYSKQAHAKRILGLMQYLEIDHWHHVMHDAGGLWTWELFKLAPNKISALTVLNSIIYQDGFCPPIQIKKGILGKLIMWGYRTKTNLMVKKLFQSGTNDYPMSKADVEGYITPLRKGKTDALYTFFTSNTKAIPDYSDTLKNIKIPVQVIWGTDDAILVWDKQANAVTQDLGLKEADVHLLSKNHFLQEEAVKEVIEYLVAFRNTKR